MSKKTASLEAAMLEYGRYIKQGEGSTRAVERAIEIYNYVADSTLGPALDMYMHVHKHIEVMPGQMMPFNAGDQPIHQAIPLAPQELTPQILNTMIKRNIKAYIEPLHAALLESNQIAGEAMDYACDNDAVQKIYAKTFDALAAYNERKKDYE